MKRWLERSIKVGTSAMVSELQEEVHPGRWRQVQMLARGIALNADKHGFCERRHLRHWMKDAWTGDNSTPNGARSSIKMRQDLLDLEDLGVIERNDDDTITVLDWTAIVEILDWELQ